MGVAPGVGGKGQAERVASPGWGPGEQTGLVGAGCWDVWTLFPLAEDLELYPECGEPSRVQKRAGEHLGQPFPGQSPVCGSWWRPGEASSPRGGSLLAHRSKLIPDHSVTRARDWAPCPVAVSCAHTAHVGLNTSEHSAVLPACPLRPPAPSPLHCPLRLHIFF